MENTSHFLFDHKEEKYFLALQGKAVGPLTAQEVYEKVSKAEATLMHYLWKEGWSDWKRICDEKEFSVLIPKKPTADSIASVRDKMSKKKSTAQGTGLKSYFLYTNRTQYGPFSKQEIVHVLQSGKIGSNSFIWVSGWSNWKRISEVDELAEFAKTVPPSAPDEAKEKKSDKKQKTKSTSVKERRIQPRRPLVARLFLHNDKEVIIAVCRDISIGGMQVLTDHVPGPVGSKIKLNVSPGDPSKVEGFVAEGEIVRHLEDGRGFSFRFLKISDQARKAIDKYIKN